MSKSKKSPLRWGLLSTANINRALITPIRKSKRSQLVAVASRSQETAEAYARKWDIPRPLGSYEALLEDPQIDVIYNSLPNGLHAEWTIKALQAGKHVLCEKPLAISLDEVDAITKAASETGNVVAEAFMYRHHPQTLKVKELVDNGAVGQLRLVRGTFTYNMTNLENVRLDAALGGGSIWDVGCYPINYARFIIGTEPVEVHGWQNNSPAGIDMLFVGQMRFAGGIYAQFDSSFSTHFRTLIEAIGSEGTISIPVPYKPGKKEQIYLVHGDKIETIKINSQEELYQGEVEDIEEAILTGKTPRVSLVDSRCNIATILALLKSAKEDRSISLS
jgi:D-xylose 1-dehydrogenase (NADP+, D-xylono-1,5-lactone-forming)